MRHRAVQPADSAAQEQLPLRDAVAGLRLALAGYRAYLPDREAAEEQLAALDAMVVAGSPDPAQLRHALLLVLAALGSVSALTDEVVELRNAIGEFTGAAG